MDGSKYIGMDVHQTTISVAVRDAARTLVMESVIGLAPKIETNG